MRLYIGVAWCYVAWSIETIKKLFITWTCNDFKPHLKHYWDVETTMKLFITCTCNDFKPHLKHYWDVWQTSVKSQESAMTIWIICCENICCNIDGCVHRIIFNTFVSELPSLFHTCVRYRYWRPFNTCLSYRFSYSRDIMDIQEHYGVSNH